MIVWQSVLECDASSGCENRIFQHQTIGIISPVEQAMEQIAEQEGWCKLTYATGYVEHYCPDHAEQAKPIRKNGS